MISHQYCFSNSRDSYHEMSLGLMCWPAVIPYTRHRTLVRPIHTWHAVPHAVPLPCRAVNSHMPCSESAVSFAESAS